MNQLVNLEDFTCNTMPKRPVVPKDLSRYPDFPVYNTDLSKEENDNIIIAYWAQKAKERKKVVQKWKKFEAKFKECCRFVYIYKTVMKKYSSNPWVQKLDFVRTDSQPDLIEL